MMWNEWWVWGTAALVLAVGEVLLPSWVLLGFAIGAGVVSILLAIGILQAVRASMSCYWSLPW